MIEHRSEQETPRRQIIETAAGLLARDGVSALTTRGVADAAGVQAPTIYRLFGDKDGLVDAVAEHVLTAFVAAKTASEHPDPLQELRAGWRMQIDFGLQNPGLFRLLNAREHRSPATEAGIAILRGRIQKLASAGLLRVSERRALALIRAAGAGAVQALIEADPESRDLGLADDMLDAVLAKIVGPSALDGASDSSTPVLVAFATRIPTLQALTDAERALLAQWVDRAIDASESQP